MSKTKFSQTVMCPAPWAQVYYQINSPSPCHLIRNGHMNMTMEEYINSEWLSNIKQKMSSGIRPIECSGCQKKESLGLKSTRGAAWGYLNLGEEPYLEDMWFSDLTAEVATRPRRLELRFSNLCNMKCRMCDETSSSEIAKEKQKFGMPFGGHPNNRNNIFFKDTTDSILKITDENNQSLKNVELLSDLRKVCFTGGEPFLIKGYYDYLDFLIENGFHKKIALELFTNTSVYNKLFMDRLMKFTQVEFTMSIDGVGKTAEYIRHGTDWDVVEKNALIFNSMPMPIKPMINVAISYYVLLDVSSLAKFLMRLYSENSTISIKCYTVLYGDQVISAPEHIKDRAIREIDLATAILDCPNFAVFRNELLNLRVKLEQASNPESSRNFIELTRAFDKNRNESFEDTFGIPLIL